MKMKANELHHFMTCEDCTLSPEACEEFLATAQYEMDDDETGCGRDKD